MDRYMSFRRYWLQSTKVIYPKTIFNLVCFRMLKFSQLLLISFFGYILSCDHTYLKPYWHHERFILISHPFESFISMDACLCDIIGFKVQRSFIQRLIFNLGCFRMLKLSQLMLIHEWVRCQL